MHPCFSIDEIIKLIACELVVSESKASAVSLMCCCKSFGDPLLDVLWKKQVGLTPLLKCLPQEVWEERGETLVSRLVAFVLAELDYLIWKSFRKIPTKAEWADFQKYARRIQNLNVPDSSKNSMGPDILLALQLRTANEPFLPRLRTLECEEPTEAFIPFIPLILSPKTTKIAITFAENSPMVATASVIGRLPTICPELEYVKLYGLARDPVITDAVSENLLACNQDSLQSFLVDSPLTEEARGVVYRLPKLSKFCAVIEGHTLLPPVELPNLTKMDIEYDDSLDWLQGFRGAILGELEWVCFRSESWRLNGFLEEFESVALTTSIQDTLSTLIFCTSSPWSPNYSSLLSFKKLETLKIEFSCNSGCSSRVDDDVIITLAQVMPRLKILHLGGAPCRTPTGATIVGLIGLASRCPDLSQLRIHFQVGSLMDAVKSAATTPPSDEPVLQWEACALTDLEVGRIPIPAGSASTVALTLLELFPRMSNVHYLNSEWKSVVEIVKNVRQIRAFVRRRGEVCCHIQLSLLMRCQEAGIDTDTQTGGWQLPLLGPEVSGPALSSLL